MPKITPIFLLMVLVLTACTLDSNEQFIQGSWAIARTDSDNAFFQWRFNNGTFTREQKIGQNNSRNTTGRYRILNSEDNVLTLELYDYSGDRISYENNPMAVRIEIDPDNDTVQITNVLFIRIGP